jgi:hypothetical protein
LTTDVHLENIGWVGGIELGKTAGTTGQSRRLEAIGIHVEGMEKQKPNWYNVLGGPAGKPHIRFEENQWDRKNEVRPWRPRKYRDNSPICSADILNVNYG